jgi:arylsulfatase A-like enzyme
MRVWDGYDAFAQTRSTQQYLREHKQDKPFSFFLSWGPPHAPYQTAPEKYQKMFPPEKVQLRDNVPKEQEETARKEVAGYYAHIAALDECLGNLMQTLEETGLAENTILVFTSDHGDMLRSQGEVKKQRPWDESIRVPLMMRMPRAWKAKPAEVDTLINTPDLMPTMLSLCNVPIPTTVEGRDLSADIRSGKSTPLEAAIILCPHPFGQWTRDMGGREYRGVRTHRHTYTRALDGPWQLYDNETDPFQKNNLCNNPDYREEQEKLEEHLEALLKASNDEFLPGDEYIKKWGYVTDKNGTVPYTG